MGKTFVVDRCLDTAPSVKRVYLKRQRGAMSRAAGKRKANSYSQKLGYGLNPYPLRLRTKMRYTNYWHPTTGAAATTSALVYFNDPYGSTPATWGVNGQPFGYDQLLSSTGPYGRYVCYAADVRLTFMNGSAGSPGSALIQVSADDTYTTLGTPNIMAQYSGQPDCHYIPYIGIKGDSNSLKRYKKRIDVAKVLGMTRKELLGNPDCWGNYNGNPFFAPSMRITTGAFAAGSSTDSDMSVRLDIVFYMVLSNRQADIPAS